MTKENSRKIIRKVLLIFHIRKEIKKYILPTFQNTTNTNLKKILFRVHGLLNFFSKCPGQYIICFCLKSHSLLLNMISIPFVLILSFFTFIWIRLLVSILFPCYKYANLIMYMLSHFSGHLSGVSFSFCMLYCVYT